MDKRYQVFVSSTYRDLREERQAVVQALLSISAFPAGMELFPASNEDQWELIKGVIDDSDYYVLVVGGRYGSTTSDGVSFTEKEFDYAVSAGKPILAFLHEDPNEIPAKHTDQNDGLRARLDAFREKVLSGRMVKFWMSAAELQAQVIQAVVAETKRNPQEGWIRTDRAADPAALAMLRAELAELKASDAPTDVDQFESGSDGFEVPVFYRKNDYSSPRKRHDAQMTWDQIFSEIGPSLMHEAPEHLIRNRLSAEALYYNNEADTNVGEAHSSEVSDETFDTIKVQLRALGLIQRGTTKRAVSDKNFYWGLTPYGDRYLMRLRARKRGMPDQRFVEPEANKK